MSRHCYAAVKQKLGKKPEGSIPSRLVEATQMPENWGPTDKTPGRRTKSGIVR